MASCPKCGMQKVGKDMQRRRRCVHCGKLRGADNMDRAGNVPPPYMADEPSPEEHAR